MKKLSYLIPILLFYGVCGQSTSMEDLWNETQHNLHSIELDNPVFFAEHEYESIGNSNIGYVQKAHQFRDAYMPEKTEGFNVSSERFIKLNQWDFYGLFSFSKYQDFKAKYTDMANPYTDNPYKIVDLSEGDWKKQHYLLQTKIAFPQLNHYTRAGIGIKYDILNGARQKDPRPLDKSINIELTPGVLFRITPNIKLGINGYYRYLNEDNSISLENHQKAQEIYKTLGIGEYLYNGPIIISNLYRAVRGNVLGGGIGWGAQWGNHHINANVSYKKGKEDNTDGTSLPYNAGEHHYNDWEGRLFYAISTRKMKHLLDFYALYRETQDVEFIQYLDNATQKYQVVHSEAMHSKIKGTARVNYTGIIKNTDNQFLWQVHSGATLYSVDDVYASTFSRDLISNLLVHIGAKRWIYTHAGTIALSYNASLKHNLEHDFIYFQKPHSDNVIANQIAYPHHIYNATNSLGHQFEAQMTFNPFHNSPYQLYIKTSLEHINPLKNTPLYNKHQNNQYFFFTLGIIN